MLHWYGSLLYTWFKLNKALIFTRTQAELHYLIQPFLKNNKLNVQVVSTRVQMFLGIFQTMHCTLRDLQLTDQSPELENFFFSLINGTL